MADWFTWTGPDLLLRVRLQPRASRDSMEEPRGDCLRVRVSAPPVDGRANERLIRLLADACGVPRSSVKLESGRTGRVKRVRICTPARLPGALAAARNATD